MFNPYLVLGYGATMLLAAIFFVWWSERSVPRRRTSAHRR